MIDMSLILNCDLHYWDNNCKSSIMHVAWEKVHIWYSRCKAKLCWHRILLPVLPWQPWKIWLMNDKNTRKKQEYVIDAISIFRMILLLFGVNLCHGSKWLYLLMKPKFKSTTEYYSIYSIVEAVVSYHSSIHFFNQWIINLIKNGNVFSPYQPNTLSIEKPMFLAIWLNFSLRNKSFRGSTSQKGFVLISNLPYNQSDIKVF